MPKNIPQIIKFTGTLIIIISTTVAAVFSAITYFDDQPKIKTKISLSPPLYTFNNEKPVEQNDLQPYVNEFLDIIFAKFSAKYFINNNLANSNTNDILLENEEKIKEKFISLKTMIPINISIANNGKRDTTILSCIVRIYGYGHGIEFQDLNLNVKEKIKSGEVVDITRSINLNGIPETLLIKMTLDALSNKLTSDDDDKKLFHSTIPSFITTLYSKEHGTSWRDVPFEVEVIVEDQRNNISTDKAIIMETIQ